MVLGIDNRRRRVDYIVGFNQDFDDTFNKMTTEISRRIWDSVEDYYSREFDAYW